MSDLPAVPIHFGDVFKVKVWGGRKLETLFGKKLSTDEPVGESWEVSEHPHGMSVVDEGPLAGTSLLKLVEKYEEELIGRPGALETGGRFPLLYKFIDASDWLSVQVHPDDAYAAAHEDGDPGKTEAWYVIDSGPGGKIARGVKPGTTRETFERSIAEGTTADCLEFIEVKRGDVVNIPTGIIHALGPGVMIAEIQQNSDTTYRIYDWGRMGLDGKPRQLHVAKALDVVDFGEQGKPLVTPVVLNETGPRHERLVTGDKFTFDRFTSPVEFSINPGELKSFVSLTCLAGTALVECGGANRPVRPGETLLLPGVADVATIKPEGDVELLAMSLPPMGR